jgi:DUF4097 and DUF4098 domain-containing protein YvlB
VQKMKKFLLLCACLVSSGLQASDYCEYEKNIDQTLDLAGSEELFVLAGAGELRITGKKDSDVAQIKGRVCVSQEEWLEQSGLGTSSGTRAEITVDLPDIDDGRSWSDNNYAYLDLRLEVPEGIRLNVKDSSGDIEMEGVGAVTVQDSSGDMNITHASGPISIKDSSGDINLSDIRGDVTIESDSSGDIVGKDIMGNVLVESDSSGDIEFSDVGEDFVVERDSSGDISANRVGGDFKVLRDGSGEIDATDVEGAVEIPADKS